MRQNFSSQLSRFVSLVLMPDTYQLKSGGQNRTVGSIPRLGVFSTGLRDPAQCLAGLDRFAIRGEVAK